MHAPARMGTMLSACGLTEAPHAPEPRRGSRARRPPERLAPPDPREGRSRPAKRRRNVTWDHSSETEARETRAHGERIYLVDRSTPELFRLMGASGVSYVVRMSQRPTCTCPDHLYRAEMRDVPCKHILFVVCRVLGASADEMDGNSLGAELLQRLVVPAPPAPEGAGDPAAPPDVPQRAVAPGV